MRSGGNTSRAKRSYWRLGRTEHYFSIQHILADLERMERIDHAILAHRRFLFVPTANHPPYFGTNNSRDLPMYSWPFSFQEFVITSAPGSHPSWMNYELLRSDKHIRKRLNTSIRTMSCDDHSAFKFDPSSGYGSRKINILQLPRKRVINKKWESDSKISPILSK